MLKQPISIVNYTNVAIVRLKVNKEKFEVACYKNKIKQFREKIENDVNEVLQVSEIFSNAVKGDKANKKTLEKVFPKMTKENIIELILLKGDIQVSEKERESNLGNVKNDIASIIAEKTFNLDTGMPFTQVTILQALNAIGANIKDTEEAKKQALKYIKEIQDKKILNIERRYMNIAFSTSELKKLNENNTKELIEFLDLIKAIYKKDNINNFNKVVGVESTKLFSLVLPQYFKDIMLKFEDKFVIEKISISEMIKPNETKEESSLINNLSNINIANSKVDQFLENNYSEEFVPKKIKCTKCKDAEFNDNIELKSHYKSNWHLFNIQQKEKEPLSYDDFQCYQIINK